MVTVVAIHFSDGVNSLSYLPRIKYFGPSVSVSWPGYRNVNDEESLPLVLVPKGCASLPSVRNDVSMNQKRREKFLS